MNSSEAHIVVVAEDSGIPPRRASVPVVVAFAQEVSARIRGGDATPILESGLVFVVFGGVLLLFLVVIVFLSAYICKSKRKGRRMRRAAAVLVKDGTNIYFEAKARKSITCST